MISQPYVKGRLIELLELRPEFGSVSLLYGKPETEADLSGSDPLLRQSLMFDDPAGELAVDEMCGPGVQEYREAWSVDVIIQVMARNRDATFVVVEDRLSTLQWSLVQAVQTASLGFVTADDTRFDQVYVELGDVEQLSGWAVAGGSNVAAGRVVVALNVEAKVTIE